MKNLIWDFDGTLFDTYPKMVSAFVQALEAAGIAEFEIDEVAIYTTMRRESVGTAIKKFAAIYGLSESRLDQLYHINEAELVKSAKPFTGLADLLAATAAAGMHHYVETHRDHLALDLLSQFELRDYFEGVVTKDQAFKRKPNPEGIEWLRLTYQLDQNQTVMIGDRQLDVDAGKNAGIQTILFDPDHLIKVYRQPDLRVSQMAELKKALLAN
ncbi:P-Ser-HPr phosphatase [Secundilactobacillus oryzae JCM 18671]|uniref:p-Ser-HPr phosphatase n=1 Tax=Secundilactobacillus oryzae JCM 18671 TaxID=1291743 RepID=A0A081BHD7_9LACO|nr:HAD-IA family hydrolase [Secundilactobacillus oryzae]GAK47455.1 P-Ser-HPr phosphatase [Secundilactobacillus oryzae JCM 18671]